MFLHIGGDVVVKFNDIISIMDLETTTVSKISKEFLTIAEEEGFVITISEDMPKSFIIAEVDNKSRIFLSPISTSTLLKRTKYLENIKNNQGALEV
jgi:hypothetical protein